MRSFLPLIRKEWRMLMFGFVMMFCSSPGQTYFIALFSGEIRHDLNLSHGEFGAIYSFATLASAILLLWSGSLIDRIGLRRFSISVVVALAAVCVLVSNSSNIFMLFIAILLLRQLGQGLMSMTSSTAMMRYIPDHKGKANSLSTMGYSAAEATMPTLVILLLAGIGWRQSWLLVGVILLVCVPPLLIFALKGHAQRHHRYLEQFNSDADATAESSRANSQQRQWTRSEVIRDPIFYLMVPGVLSQSMLYTGFMFHQIHMVEEKGWSLALWASLYLIFSITTIVMSLAVGNLVDRVGAIRLAPFVTIPMAIGLLALSSSDSSAVAFIFMSLMAVSTGAQAAITSPFFSERYGNRNFASIKSLGAFTMVFLSALSPVILGWFIDRGVSIDSLAQGFASYAVCACGLAFLGYQLSLRQTYSGAV